MTKGDKLTLDITDINNLGCGVAKLDGKVIFVKGAVTGDTVAVTVIKDNKSYAVAKLDNIILASPHRTQRPYCTAPLSCGGCVYRHITYEHEKQIKYNFVRSAFDKSGLQDIKVLNVISTGQDCGYRNKAQYPVTNTKEGMRCGFYASKTHKIAVTDSCSIQNKVFSEITEFVCMTCDKYGIDAYDEQTGKGLLRHIYLRIGEITGEVMLCLVVNGKALPKEKQIAFEITERFPNIVSLVLNENMQNTNVVLGKSFRTLFGKAYIEDILCGLRFRISPDSFYQVNRAGAELLYRLASEKALLDGTQTLVDLYCGTGTIGLSMADKAKELIGIEIVESSVACARRNAEANGISNARFVCADAGVAANILTATDGKRPDVVIIDPPRKGSTYELAKCLSTLDVPKIVYISCDPTTLARDCTYFRELGYTVGEVQPVDMFPRTGHVECVCLICKDI